MNQVTVVYIVSLIEVLSAGLLIPLLGPHLRSLGCSNTLIGFLTSSCAFIQIISNPIAGSLSDRKGRKPLLIAAAICSCVCNLGMAYFSTSVAGIFVSQIMLGVTPQKMVLLKTLIADVTPPEKQPSVYAKITSFAYCGVILGPIIGGQILGASEGFFYLALLLAVLNVCSFVVTQFLPNTKPKQNPKEEKRNLLNTSVEEIQKSIGNFKQVRWKVYWDLFTFKFLAETTIQVYITCMFMLLKENFDLTNQSLGWSIGIAGFLRTFGFLISAKVVEKFYSWDKTGNVCTCHGFTLMALSFFVMVFVSSYWLYIACFITLFTPRSIIDILWTHKLVARMEKSEKGVVMGAYESLNQIAKLMSPLIGGILMDVFGTNGPAIICVVPPLIGAIVANKLI